MPNAANLQARKAARILASAHTLSIVYPPQFVPATTATTPGALPTSPLTGTRQFPTLVPPAAPAPTDPLVTVACLWYDSLMMPRSQPGMDGRFFGPVGWRDDANAVAEVLVSDVAIDPVKPYGPTKFDGALQVIHGNETYRILQVRPMESSFAQPSTYLVWLITAANQPAS